jgi:hypothetical protein
LHFDPVALNQLRITATRLQPRREDQHASAVSCSEVGEADLEVDFGGVAFDAVGEVEADEGEDDVVEVDAEAGADVGAPVVGGEVVGEVVAVGGAAVVEAGVAGVVEGEARKERKRHLKRGMEYSVRKTARRSPRNWSTS